MEYGQGEGIYIFDSGPFNLKHTPASTLLLSKGTWKIGEREFHFLDCIQSRWGG